MQSTRADGRQEGSTAPYRRVDWQRVLQTNADASSANTQQLELALHSLVFSNLAVEDGHSISCSSVLHALKLLQIGMQHVLHVQEKLSERIHNLNDALKRQSCRLEHERASAAAEATRKHEAQTERDQLHRVMLQIQALMTDSSDGSLPLMLEDDTAAANAKCAARAALSAVSKRNDKLKKLHRCHSDASSSPEQSASLHQMHNGHCVQHATHDHAQKADAAISKADAQAQTDSVSLGALAQCVQSSPDLSVAATQTSAPLLTETGTQALLFDPTDLQKRLESAEAEKQRLQSLVEGGYVAREVNRLEEVLATGDGDYEPSHSQMAREFLPVEELSSRQQSRDVSPLQPIVAMTTETGRDGEGTTTSPTISQSKNQGNHYDKELRQKEPLQYQEADTVYENSNDTREEGTSSNRHGEAERSSIGSLQIEQQQIDPDETQEHLRTDDNAETSYDLRTGDADDSLNSQTCQKDLKVQDVYEVPVAPANQTLPRREKQQNHDDEGLPEVPLQHQEENRKFENTKSVQEAERSSKRHGESERNSINVSLQTERKEVHAGESQEDSETNDDADTSEIQIAHVEGAGNRVDTNAREEYHGARNVYETERNTADFGNHVGFSVSLSPDDSSMEELLPEAPLGTYARSRCVPAVDSSAYADRYASACGIVDEILNDVGVDASAEGLSEDEYQKAISLLQVRTERELQQRGRSSDDTAYKLWRQRLSTYLHSIY